MATWPGIDSPPGLAGPVDSKQRILRGGLIPEDLAAEMVNEKGFLDIIKAVNPGKPNPELIETLEGFNTWDEVHFHGGLMNKGDVFELGLGSDVEEIFAKPQCIQKSNLGRRRPGCQFASLAKASKASTTAWQCVVMTMCGIADK